ncbi:Ets domain and Winged helix-turn-helix DNA-binding domain-containing protein [Strongyloides ratti]|uniref:Ets domain and Winged helix-turn-helix DNA-binding domain-containing protein n=1 Tax=Strongyloides ratti TaxID=34506 RepID=A0A090L532_STRRB|nr:Ets domain and Winged helix-turn-helix DNA-binding domain-containing protein [Strongyloides ratti]CEF64916.1 Ets domain and Winged helix-turn-helix DNA-binding domain-containing protein [Strongyloides ratti]
MCSVNLVDESFFKSLPTTIDGRTKVKNPYTNFIDFSSCPYNIKLLQLKRFPTGECNKLWNFLLFLLSNKKDYGKLLYWCGPCGLFRISNMKGFLNLWNLLKTKRLHKKNDIIKTIEFYSRKYKFIKIIGKHRHGNYFYKFDLKYLMDYLNKKIYTQMILRENLYLDPDVFLLKNTINNIVLNYEKSLDQYKNNNILLGELERRKNLMLNESKAILCQFISNNEGNQKKINIGLSMLCNINTLSQFINPPKGNQK